MPSINRVCKSCGRRRLLRFFLESVQCCKSCLYMCNSDGCTNGSHGLGDNFCFDCQQRKILKRKRCCEDRKESYVSDISDYDSNLTAFGMKLLLEVSKGKLMMMSDTPIFSSMDCRHIHKWMAKSKFSIEPINIDYLDDNSR